MLRKECDGIKYAYATEQASTWKPHLFVCWDCPNKGTNRAGHLWPGSCDQSHGRGQSSPSTGLASVLILNLPDDGFSHKATHHSGTGSSQQCAMPTLIVE